MLLSPRLDLFVPTARFPCFRQPVLLNAGDHLLAFAENRNVSSCAPSISSNEIGSLQLRRSADNGATWTAMQQVWRGNIDFYTAVHDMRGTTILMLQEGAATNVFNSTDFGASWSAPTPLSVPLPPGVTSIKPAVGHGVQLQPDLCASPCREAGRLVLPFVCQNASGCGDRGGSSCAACALLSDDGGASWRVGGLGQPSSRESQLVQTASATTSASLYVSERNMGPTAGKRVLHVGRRRRDLRRLWPHLARDAGDGALDWDRCERAAARRWRPPPRVRRAEPRGSARQPDAPRLARRGLELGPGGGGDPQRTGGLLGHGPRE